MKFGIQSEVGKIESIMIKHPLEAFQSQVQIDAQWEKLHYYGRPDFQVALEEYEKFISIFTNEGIDIQYLPADDAAGIDSIYVRDAVVMTPHGAILCRMGKEARQGEPEAAGNYLKKLGVPIIGKITGEGQLEGGDLVWLDAQTLAIGRGYRTNDEGIDQLRNMISNFGVRLIVVPLPHWQGPDDVFHLMSIISPIDYDLAVVYSRLMPVPFRELLIDRGIELLEVPENEFAYMAGNILALAPRRCLMLSGNPRTGKLLEDAGVEVIEYQGEEISKKGAGGPTCLTRPLCRRD